MASLNEMEQALADLDAGLTRVPVVAVEAGWVRCSLKPAKITREVVYPTGPLPAAAHATFCGMVTESHGAYMVTMPRS